MRQVSPPTARPTRLRTRPLRGPRPQYASHTVRRLAGGWGCAPGAARAGFSAGLDSRATRRTVALAAHSAAARCAPPPRRPWPANHPTRPVHTGAGPRLRPARHPRPPGGVHPRDAPEGSSARHAPKQLGGPGRVERQAHCDVERRRAEHGGRGPQRPSRSSYGDGAPRDGLLGCFRARWGATPACMDYIAPDAGNK